MIVRPTLEIRDPRGLTLQQWADSMNMQFALVDVERVESDWQGWASRLTLSHDLMPDQIPSPYGFSDWQSWVNSFNRALTSASY